MSKNNLSNTWVLVKCGNKKFALNYNYINSMEDFGQASCVKTTSITGIKRGIYKIMGSDIMVLDGRKLVGEKSIETIKLENSAFINSLKTELLQWVDNLDWAILTGKDVETDYTKFKIYSWIKEETDDKSVDMIKKRMEIPFRELFILAEDALENRNNLEKGSGYSIGISEDIKSNIEKMIIKPLNRVIQTYNKNIDESCIVINHNNIRYGVTVDSIEAVTENVTIVPKYSEYKVIAGDCYYKSEKYNIFNVKYLSELTKRFNT